MKKRPKNGVKRGKIAKIRMGKAVFQIRIFLDGPDKKCRPASGSRIKMPISLTFWLIFCEKMPISQTFWFMLGLVEIYWIFFIHDFFWNF